MNDRTDTTSLRARFNGWRSSLVGWLRRFADRLDSDLGLWLWGVVGVISLLAIGLAIWIF